MLVSKEQILEYIPQQPPFSMVDTLEYTDDKSARSTFHILDTNILSSEGILRESGLVENMAQTIALYAGYKARQSNIIPPIGYIAGIKNLKITRLPNIDETIFTQVEITNKVMNMQIATAEVFDAKNEQLASCELRIFITE